MQSHNSVFGQVRLLVDAGDPATEVFVIDGHLKRIARGHGHVDSELPPGIYKVKFVAGALAREVYVPLEPGKASVAVPPPALPFSTPVPLKQTRTTHDYHENNASRLSMQVHRQVGTGSQLFVFVRDLDRQGWEDPATGLTLHDLAGNLLVDFSKDGERSITDPGTDHWAGCTVQLDPGSYRLRVRGGTEETLEQVVVTSLGWQTQVFLLQHLCGSRQQRVRRANLSNAALFMAPLGRGFEPERPDFRQAELVRQGLARSRVVIEPGELGEMNWATQENPMLGIYGAHLLLLTPQPDQDLLRKLIDRLHTTVGAHPDVTALSVRLAGPPAALPIYAAPPMLRSSWRTIVHASITHPEIVPPASLATHVADRLWGDNMWLTWQERDQAVPPQTIKPLDLPLLCTLLPQLAMKIAGTNSSEPLIEIARVSALSNLERFLLEYITMSMRRKGFEVLSPDSLNGNAPRLQAWGRDNLTNEKLVQALGAPAAAISEAAGGLVTKLKLLG